MYDFLEALITQQTSPDEAYRKFDAIAAMLPALADHLGVLAPDQLEHTVASALLLVANLLPGASECGGAEPARLVLLPAHFLAVADPHARWFPR